MLIDMNDKEKSIALLQLRGLDYTHNEHEPIITKLPSELLTHHLRNPYYLYDTEHFLLAWGWLNWVDDHPDPVLISMFTGWWANEEMIEMKPAEAKRVGLDKILELAIEAGKVGGLNEQ